MRQTTSAVLSDSQPSLTHADNEQLQLRCPDCGSAMEPEHKDHRYACTAKSGCSVVYCNVRLGSVKVEGLQADVDALVVDVVRESRPRTRSSKQRPTSLALYKGRYYPVVGVFDPEIRIPPDVSAIEEE